MVANRVDPETGKAAKLGNSKLRLSRWAEGYEREQGRIRCERRVKNNERRRAGEEVLRPIWDRPLHWARFRREGGLPEAQITAGNRIKSYRTARSAFPAVGLEPAGPRRESGKLGLEWRDSRAPAASSPKVPEGCLAHFFGAPGRPVA